MYWGSWSFVPRKRLPASCCWPLTTTFQVSRRLGAAEQASGDVMWGETATGGGGEEAKPPDETRREGLKGTQRPSQPRVTD